MNFLLIINLIYCSKNKKSNKIGFSMKNKLNRIKRSKNQDNNSNKNNGNGWHHPIVIPNTVSRCVEDSKVKLITYNLELLNFSTIFNLSYYFYEKLIKHPNFTETCRKLKFDINNDIPSKEIFRSFVIKYIIHQEFNFNKTKVNYFMQSIAWLVHKHIVHWSQSHLTTYMFNRWSIVWEDIIDSIDISTDRFCYWRVIKLFDGDKLKKANDQLDAFEILKIRYPTLYDEEISYNSKLSYFRDSINRLPSPSISIN